MKFNPLLQVDPVKEEEKKIENVQTQEIEDGPGSCPEGKTWDPAANDGKGKCVPIEDITTDFKGTDVTLQTDVDADAGDLEIEEDKLSDKVISTTVKDGSLEDAIDIINEEFGEYYDKTKYNSKEVQDIVQGFIYDPDGILNSGDEISMMDGFAQYTYSVLAKNEELTDGTKPEEIESLHDKVSFKMFEGIFPEFTYYQSKEKAEFNEGGWKTFISDFIRSVSDVDGSINTKKYYNFVKSDFLKKNPHLSKWAEANRQDISQMNMTQLRSLRCGLIMKHRYTARQVGNMFGGYSGETVSDPYTQSDRMAGGKGGVTYMCNKYGSLKEGDDLAMLDMLMHYDERGNLSKYTGNWMTDFDGLENSKRYFESAMVWEEEGTDEKQYFPIVFYNKFFQDKLEFLRAELLLGPDNKPLYKTQEQKIWLDAFIEKVSDGRFLAFATSKYQAEFVSTEHSSTIPVEVQAKRGTINTKEGWENATLEEKLLHLTVYKASLLKEIRAESLADAEFILEYYGATNIDAAKFVELKEEKLKLINDIDAFWKRHLPQVNKAGETIYPNDPNDSDDMVRKGVGAAFFEIDYFEDYFEGIKNKECPLIRKVEKRAFQDDKITHVPDTSCLSRMNRDLKENPDKYWKEYIARLAGEDKTDQENFWEGYKQWRDESYFLSDIITEDRTYQELLTGAVINHSKSLTDQYGLEEKHQDDWGFLSIIGVDKIIADEIREGMKDVRAFNALRIKQGQHLKGPLDEIQPAYSYAMGINGKITLVPHFHTKNDYDGHALLGLGGKPQLVNGRWYLSPAQRLDGYYVDENNELQMMDIGDIEDKGTEVGGAGGESQAEIKAHVEGRIKRFLEGKLSVIQQEGNRLFGVYSDDAVFDEKGKLISGKQLKPGAIQKWNEKYGEDFELFSTIQEQLSFITTNAKGELVFKLEGKYMVLDEWQIEYFSGLEAQYRDLKEKLITGGVKSGEYQGFGGSTDVVISSAMMDMRNIVMAMNHMQKKRDDFTSASKSFLITSALMEEFNLNFSSWDKAISGVSQMLYNVITPFGYSEEARAKTQQHSEYYPQSYQSEWGEAGAWIESMMVDASGTVALWAVAAGMMMVPGGQYASMTMFHLSGTGGKYNSLKQAKIDAVATIEECDKMLAPDYVGPDGKPLTGPERASLLRKAERAEQAANQDEASMMFASFCAGTVEMLFERYITLPILQGPFKKGNFSKAKWLNMTKVQKTKAVTGYVLKGKGAELLGENLTTISSNIIDIIQTGKGSLFTGIWTEDGGFDFDAQMQLLTTTLLLSGPSDVKMLTNIITAEVSTTIDKKNRKETRDALIKLDEKQKALNNVNYNALSLQDKLLHDKQVNNLVSERQELQEKMVVHTEQSFNRLKYLTPSQLTELDGYAEKRRLLNIELFELGQRENPKDPKTIEDRARLINEIKDQQLLADGVVESAMADAIPGIEGGDNSYGTTKKKIKLSDGTEITIDVVNYAVVRPEAMYLEGLYLSSNIRTRNICEKNGGSYFEINEKSYTYDEKGKVVSFNPSTQKMFQKHFEGVFEGTADPVARATQEIQKLLESSLDSGKNAGNIGKDVFMFTINARRAIYNTPTIDGKTNITLQQAEDAAVSGLHEIFHINHAQTELTIKVDTLEDGTAVYETMTVEEIVNTEKGKKHASLVVSSMDQMMKEEFGSKVDDKKAQAIWEHYKKRKEVYTNEDGVLNVEEVLNIIGDLIAVGNFADVDSKYKNTGVLNNRFFSLNTEFGQTLKMLINGINRRITGNDMVDLGQFDNEKQIVNYINRFYENSQGKSNFNLIQKIVGETFEKTEFKLSKSEYQKNLEELETEYTGIGNKYLKLMEGKEGKEKQDIFDEYQNVSKKLKSDIDKIKSNIALSKKNDETVKTIKREQEVQNVRRKQLQDLKGFMEEHGENGAVDPITKKPITLKEVIELLENLPETYIHSNAKSKLVLDNDGIVQDFINNNYKLVPGGVSLTDFKGAMNLEISLIINSFNPDKLVTDVNGVEPGPPPGAGYIPTNPNFGFYFRQNLRYRLGNILKKAEMTAKELDMNIKTVSIHDETSFVNEIEDTDGFNPDEMDAGDGVNTNISTSEFRRSLPNVTDDVRNKIIKKSSKIVEEVNSEIKTSKRNKIRKKLQKKYSKAFVSYVEEGIGSPTVKQINPITGKSEVVVNPKFVNYLKENKQMIVNLIAIKYNSKFPGIAIKGERLNVKESLELMANPDYPGFIQNVKGGSILWEQVQFDDPNAPNYMTEQAFVDYFTIGDGTKKGMRNARETRYNSLVTSLAAEMGLDATFDALKENDPTDTDNYISYYAETLKRDPKMKFSVSGKEFDFPSYYDFSDNKLHRKLTMIFDILKTGDHVDLIDLDSESETFMTLKGYEDNTFIKAEVALAYSIIRELNPSNIDQSSVQLRTSLLNNEDIPQHFKDKIQKVDWSTNKDMKDRKAEQVSSFALENMSSEVLSIIGLDILGFHNSALDSAETKYLKDENGTVVVYFKRGIPPKIILDGKEVKNQSFYGKIPTEKQLSKMTNEEKAALKFGVYNIVGWEYMPSENMFKSLELNEEGFPYTSRDPVSEYNAEIKTGDYNSIYNTTKDGVSKNAYNGNVDLDAVRPMNKTFPLFKEIDKILTQDLPKESFTNENGVYVKGKLELLEALAPEIEAASVANRELAVEIVGGMLDAVANGKMDMDVFVSILQSQTSLAKGLRALSGLDFIYVKDGVQEGRTYGEHMDPNVRLMLEITLAAIDLIEFNEKTGEAIGFKKDADVKTVLKNIFDKHTQFYANSEIANMLDKPKIAPKKLPRGLKPLLNIGLEINKKDGVDALMDLSDKLDELDNEQADELADYLNLAIEYMEDGYNVQATQALKKFNQACKEAKDGKELKLSTTDLGLERFKLLPQEILEGIIAPNGTSYFDRIVDIEISKVVNTQTNKIKTENQERKNTEIKNSVRRETRKNSLLSGESQGASVFDFDETLIEGGANIIKAIHPLTGQEIDIDAADFHSVAQEYKAQGFEFNFDDFINVKGGKQGPLFQKFINQIEKYGVENVIILTARQPGAALAIQMWLEENGVSLPLENITGLGVMGPDGKPIYVDGKTKAAWIEQNLIKNGYNDIYFVDDSQAIVDDVKEMMLKYPKEILLKGGKSIVVDPDFGEIHAKYSKSTKSEVLNDFIEVTQGIDPVTGLPKFSSEKRFSPATARLAGSKIGTYNNVIPYSAEDFNGLLYQLLAEGDQGEYQYRWFQENLIKPYSRGEVAISQEKVKVTSEYKNLLRSIPKIKKKLKTIVNRSDGTPTNFTLDHAVRVYLWHENEIDIPGISDRDLKLLVNTVKKDITLRGFADQLGAISNQDGGYIKAGDYWTMENIASDINNIINVVGREKHLKEFLENKNEIFNEENLNKIEAAYGTKFRESLELMLDRMETGNSNGKQSVKGDRVTDMYNTWVNNSVGAVMFLNGRSAVLQTLSTANYVKISGPNNMFNAAQAFADQPQFWADFVTLWNSDYLVSRRSGQQRGINEAELAAAVENADNKPKAAIAWLLSKGFLPTQIADSFAIASGGACYVRNYTNAINDMLLDFRASGADITTLFEAQDVFTKGDLEIYLKGRDINSLTDQEIEDLAYNIANDAFVLETESGQQSSRQDMLSQQQTGGLGRLILAFKNTPMQYTRKILRATQDIKNGRGNTAQHIADIAYYGVIQSLMFTGLQQALFAGLGEEDEEWEEREDKVIQGMVDNILNGMGLGGVIIATVKNGLLEFQEQEKKGWNADHTYTILEFANFSPTIGSKLRKIYSSIKTQQLNEGAIAEMDLWDPRNPAWSSVANLVSALTNIPLDRAVNKLNNLLAISADENEWWQNLAMLLGWNTWDVGVDKYSKEFNEKAKEKNKIIKDLEKENEAVVEIQGDVEEEIEKQKEQKESGEEVDSVSCAYVNSSNKRCKVKVNKAGDRCQYHVENTEDVKQCNAIKKDKTRCKQEHTNKNGYCQYHQPESK